MVIDSTSARSRRALLAGTLGGVVALIAGALGRPLSGQAADGDVIHVGETVSGTGSTRITTTGDIGLSATSESAAGYGVTGHATTASGSTWGVYGWSESTEGSGVAGEATATSGNARGMSGRSESTEGYGVAGVATATSGDAWGVYGRSDSTEGLGVYGVATEDGGRGGVFSGGAAQLRLEPASTGHPKSGLQGDLFLDNDGALWLCKGDTDWKQIA